MKQLFLLLAILAFNGFVSEKAHAQEVSVVLTTDEEFSNRAIIEKMQHNLSQVLTEINRAQKENRLLLHDSLHERGRNPATPLLCMRR